MTKIFMSELSQLSRMPELADKSSGFSIQSYQNVGIPRIMPGGSDNFNIAGMRKISCFHVIKSVLVAVENTAKRHRPMNFIFPPFGAIGIIANEKIIHRILHAGPPEDAHNLICSVFIDILQADRTFRMICDKRRTGGK